MTQNQDPTVVDLDRYKQAARAARAKAAKAEKAAKATAPRESFFGSRPKAPVLLALLILAFVFLYLGPHLMHGH